MTKDPLSRGFRFILLILSITALAFICFICICRIGDEIRKEAEPTPSASSLIYGDNEPAASSGFLEEEPAETLPETSEEASEEQLETLPEEGVTVAAEGETPAENPAPETENSQE